MPFEELKERQAGAWSAGPYQGITETIADLQGEVISRLGPGPGQRFLDLACGTGATSELAAAGADVVGVDFAPALIETAKRRAEERSLDIDYRIGDVEALDLPDGSFDRVASTCGVMFAPDHSAVARELWVRDYGPTKVLAESLDDDKREELHRNFVELSERSRVNGGLRVARAYLLTVGTRR
jgi:2-polyprenyl-3-methyl-5-hydroxy-6-metoxy-1,4-benzoquinol methylase